MSKHTEKEKQERNKIFTYVNCLLCFLFIDHRLSGKFVFVLLSIKKHGKLP